MVKYLIVFLMLLFPISVFGANCTITTSSTPAQILSCLDGLTAGDTATINSGTYNDFPLSCIVANGTSENWITIKGSDPDNRPVIDFVDFADFIDTGTQPTKDASCSGGNVTWAVFTALGRYIEYKDIEVKNAHHSNGSISAFVTHPDQGPIQITNIKATYNDSGYRNRSAGVTEHIDGITTLTGVELGYNGSLPGTGNVNHQIYGSGGNFIVEYSWLHDSSNGQLVQSRSSRMTIRYSYLDNSYSYVYQMADSREDTYGDVYSTQEHTFLGNIIVEKTEPANDAQVFVVAEQQEKAFAQKLYLYYNTLIGYGSDNNFFHIVAAETEDAEVYAYNNIFYNWTGNIADCDGGDGDVYAQYNIFPTAMSNGDCLTASNNIDTNVDQFVSYSGGDYHLAIGVAAIDAANSGLGTAPSYEYGGDMDEASRDGTNDIGCFEYDAGTGTVYITIPSGQVLTLHGVLEIN